MKSRAHRRRIARELKKQEKRGPPEPEPPKATGGEIQLQNPVAQHFEAFIFGNAEHCDHVVAAGQSEGKHIVICGAGPSLREHADEWIPQADEVWGCNSALPWLHDNGHRVTHGFTVDQTPHMITEWYSAPPVEYIVASTIHPHLTEYLLSKGRTLRWFHNFVGLKKPPVEWEGRRMMYEDWMYTALYPPTVRAGSGLNTVNRAVDVARYAGAERVTILGADCALRVKSNPPDLPHTHPDFIRWLKEETEMHADGGHALVSGATAVTLHAEIDGRLWVTKPDMAISAVWLADVARHHPEVELVGDTLPNAVKDKPETFMDRLPHLSNSDGSPMRYHPSTMDPLQAAS